MKSKIIFPLFLLIAPFSFSQATADLKAKTMKYYDAHYTMDFDEIVNLTYPKVVETIIRTVMTSKLDSDYENEDFRMRLELEKPDFGYAPIKKIDGKTFCIITYKNPVRYFFEEKLDAEEGAKKAAALKAGNKAYDAVFEPKRNSINVKKISRIIAISDESTKNQWKFINPDDPGQTAVFETLISADAKTQLGL